jgi:hypothetical protein
MTIGIPEPILRGVGDVAISSVSLDWQVAAFHAALRGDLNQIESSFAKPGSRIRSEIVEMLDAETLDAELAAAVRARINGAAELAEERDRVVHGYVWLGPTTSGTSGVMSRHARSKQEQELTEPSLVGLARRLVGWVMGSGPTLVRVIIAKEAASEHEINELRAWLRVVEPRRASEN